MTNYFSKPKSYMASSHYRVLDDKDQCLSGQAIASCYSALTYQKLSAGADKINVYIPQDETGYKESSIIRWTDDMNELGFKFQYAGLKSNQYNFFLSVDDFKGKVLFCIVLQLIRYLSEMGLAEIPDRYFNLVDAGEDKFVALQKAHLSSGTYSNYNHASRSLIDKTIITQEKFWKNLKRDKTSARDSEISTRALNTSNYWI